VKRENEMNDGGIFKLKKIISGLLILSMVLGLSGCSWVQMKLKGAEESIIGIDFKILEYDAYGNNTLTAQGKHVSMGLFENFANGSKDSTGFRSEVLDITVEGKQLLHVGSTLVLAERGINKVQDYDIDYLKNAQIKGTATFVPLDRTINNVMNLVGKSKTIIVKSQMGILIGVYQGDDVMVEVPENLPKTTRLIVDGKSLYIYKADYDIFDTKMFKGVTKLK
jgi:hypothetical protein